MSESGTSMEKSETPEVVEGFSIEPLTPEALAERLPEISRLGTNALHKDESIAERIRKLDHLRTAFARDKGHWRVLLLKKNDALVGFCAIEQRKSSRQATLKYLRLASLQDESAVAALLVEPRKEFMSEGYKTQIEAPQMIKALEDALTRSEIKDIWHMSDASAGAGASEALAA